MICFQIPHFLFETTSQGGNISKDLTDFHTSQWYSKYTMPRTKSKLNSGFIGGYKFILSLLEISPCHWELKDYQLTNVRYKNKCLSRKAF